MNAKKSRGHTGCVVAAKRAGEGARERSNTRAARAARPSDGWTPVDWRLFQAWRATRSSAHRIVMGINASKA